MTERGKSLKGGEGEPVWKPAPVLKVKRLNKAKIRTPLTVLTMCICVCVCVYSSVGPSAAVIKVG